MNEISLRVGDAKQRDVARGIARIDQKTMEKLNVSAGDVIEIFGKRRTSAIAWPAYSEDQGRDIIRIDGFSRKNAGVSINEYVTITKAEVKDAVSIVLAPIDMRLNVDEDFTNFVKNRLMERTFIEGDTTLVMMLGHPVQFTVMKTRPHGILRLTYDTKLQILTEPAPEAKLGVPRTTYEDIGGLQEEIQRLREMVELPMRHPEIFQRLGIDPPKGVLLHGPPGCGKTLLARAVATESEANFISIKGPEVFSKWVGESEKAIREVFRKARMSAPSIVFFDEMDSLVPRRGSGYGDSGVTDRVISQLLTEIDGITALQDVVVIAATNRPDIVDPAVLRPGRFDRLIYVPEPGEEGRLQILKIHAKGMPLAKDVDLQELARVTKGYSGADIESACREAALYALRKDINSKEVTIADFTEAFKKVGPSITPDMENWYKGFSKQVRRVQKPAPLVA